MYLTKKILVALCTLKSFLSTDILYLVCLEFLVFILCKRLNFFGRGASERLNSGGGKQKLAGGNRRLAEEEKCNPVAPQKFTAEIFVLPCLT